MVEGKPTREHRLDEFQIAHGLLKAAARLQGQANASRGTVMDDDKVPALEFEIEALLSAHKLVLKDHPRG